MSNDQSRPDPLGAFARSFDSLTRRLRDASTDQWQRAVVLPALAFLTALAVSAVIVIASDVDNLERLGSDPGDALANMVSNVASAYWALITGSVGSLRAISETLTNSAPFIIGGLASGLAFRAGLFNIGIQGQMIVGGLFATWAGFALGGPQLIHLPIALAVGAIGGALWGAVPGILKARTGAHEVIVTIMMNNIALLGLTWVLKTSLFQADGRVDPISKAIDSSARLPRLLGILDRSDLRVHLGIVLALLLAALVWWLLFRSTLGFQFRAVGSNPTGATYAGMSVVALTGLVMAISGALGGLAGSNEVLGVQGRAAPGFAGTIGFDSISVALLGRSHPGGIVVAGLLFGAMKAGAQEMQVSTNVPIDMIQIIQALIIIFVAAPGLIRAIFRLKQSRSTTGRDNSDEQATPAATTGASA